MVSIEALGVLYGVAHGAWMSWVACFDVENCKIAQESTVSWETTLTHYPRDMSVDLETIKNFLRNFSGHDILFAKFEFPKTLNT